MLKNENRFVRGWACLLMLVVAVVCFAPSAADEPAPRRRASPYDYSGAGGKPKVTGADSTPEKSRKPSHDQHDKRPSPAMMEPGHAMHRESEMTLMPEPAAPAAFAMSAANSPRDTPGVTKHYFPTGDRACSAILLERVNPVEVRLGEGYRYEIKITNLIGQALHDVKLTEKLADGFEFSGAQPEGGSTPTLNWNVGTLGPRETKTFTINGTARRTGRLEACAQVTFRTEICSAVKVVEPVLQLTKTMPAEVVLCDPIPATLMVRNAGSGVARNVRVSEMLPKGLTTAEGQSQIMLTAGDLPDGAAREFHITLKAAATGKFTNTVAAMEDGGLTAEATADVKVLRPVLTVTKTGPETRYIGRPAKYQITVANTGDAAAADTVLTDEVPSGTTFVSASDSGALAGDKLVWKLGEIAPGASRTVEATFKPTIKGEVKNNVSVVAYCAEATATFTTQAIGIPAILLEVVDLEDPIEVGANCTYEVIVTNQGTADGTNIAVTCTLPPEMEFVSAIGPVPFTQNEKGVTFHPLARLAEQGKAVYRLTARGVEVGDVRFRVSMTTDQQQVPVEESESTHVYK